MGMNMPSTCTRDLLLRSLRDHDMAAKNNMKIATLHLKRGYEIARQLEQIEHSEFRQTQTYEQRAVASIHSEAEIR